MKSPTRHHRPKRSRWAHVNTPDGLRRRAAKADARREAIAALLPPVPDDPAPLSLWQSVLVLDARGEVMQRIDLHVPTAGHRCDQHAVLVGGQRMLLSATQVGRRVAALIRKRPSQALQADTRREEYLAARAELETVTQSSAC